MSATLGTLLSELQPDWKIVVYERLHDVGLESSNAWNNAGTGHLGWVDFEKKAFVPHASVPGFARGLSIIGNVAAVGLSKLVNAKTKDMEPETPIPVKITVFSDRSFTFEMKSPPASFFLKKAAKSTSGSKTPGVSSAGTVTMAQCREIAKTKLKDLNSDNIDQAARTIAGSARSMGLQVTE